MSDSGLAAGLAALRRLIGGTSDRYAVYNFLGVPVSDVAALRRLAEEVERMQEARTAALKEALAIAEGGARFIEAGNDVKFISAKDYARDMALDIADGIRALLPAPPASEDQ